MVKKHITCSTGYKRDRKSGRCVFLKNIGFSSHGRWSTLGKLRDIETERGNPFPKISHPRKIPAIWITFDKITALRYALPAEDWDRIEEGGSLTKKEKNIMRYDIVSIPLEKRDEIITDDGDGGYLLIRLK